MPIWRVVPISGGLFFLKRDMHVNMSICLLKVQEDFCFCPVLVFDVQLVVGHVDLVLLLLVLVEIHSPTMHPGWIVYEKRQAVFERYGNSRSRRDHSWSGGTRNCSAHPLSTGKERAMLQTYEPYGSALAFGLER